MWCIGCMPGVRQCPSRQLLSRPVNESAPNSAISQPQIAPVSRWFSSSKEEVVDAISDRSKQCQSQESFQPTSFTLNLKGHSAPGTHAIAGDVNYCLTICADPVLILTISCSQRHCSSHERITAPLSRAAPPIPQETARRITASAPRA